MLYRMALATRNTFRLAKLSWRSALLLTLISLSNTYAQQSANPDYSNVSDILKGKRTVLQDDDLVVTAFKSTGTTPSSGALNSTILNTTKGQVSSAQPTTGTLGIGDDRIKKVFSGRFYQSDHDLSVRVVPAAPGPPSLLLTDQTVTVAGLPLPGGANGDTIFSAATGDFSGNGYPDFVVNFGPGDETGKMVVFSGTNPDGSKNLRFGPARIQSDNQETLLAMTAGDFNGDGRMEIAGLAYKKTGRYAVVIYTVDPITLAISKAAELTPSYKGETQGDPISYFSMATGRFTAAPHNQIVLAYATMHGNAKIEVLDFASQSLQPIEKGVYATASGFIYTDYANGGFIQVDAGQFNFTTGYDQVLFTFAWYGNAYSPNSGVRFFQIFAVDPSNETLQYEPKSFTDFSQMGCVSNAAVGNYDKKTTGSTGKTQPFLGLQVALIMGSCDPATPKTLQIYGINPVDYSSDVDQIYNLPSQRTGSTAFTLSAADLQGRSYLLGPPTKLVINQATQPTAVIAMPPMHVDYVRAVNVTNPNQIDILDVSAAPHGFKTSYSLDTSKGEESSSSDTTSVSFGTKETVGGSIGVGDIDAGEGLETKDVFTATQDLKKSVDTESGTTHKSSFSLNASTLVGDYIYYNESRLNLWIYPVIGKLVCPASVSTATCSPNQKVPMTIQFSAPDQTSNSFGSGSNIEWYQPPWEPFNVFSYPANLAQLKLIYPNLQELASGNEAFTDQGALDQKAQWTSGSNVSKTASFEQNLSFENDFSVAGKVNLEVVSLGFEAGIDVSGSRSFSELNKSVTEYSSTTGIGVSFLGSFLDPSNYRYPFTPIIFGETKPSTVVDNPALNTDVTAYGLVRTAFIADPARSSSGNAAGGWWKQAYNTPDVALNRPVHLSLTTPTGGGENPPNCLPWGSGASQIDCFSAGTFSPASPWTSEFHFMRGFFISNNNAPGQGPQLSMATAGDKLFLQARVYNYSLTAMPDNTEVHARFYVQPIDPANNAPKGNSVLIGEDKLASIPPFSDAPDAPLNWTLASTTFDTTSYPNQNVFFWVVVWMQTPGGSMIHEMPHHGLKAIPGALNSLADVATEDYSNNVGLYKVMFPILPKGSLEQRNGPSAINIGKIELSATRIGLNQPVDVSAPLTSLGNDAAGATAMFFDGNPDTGGQLFDVERLAYLNAETVYQAKVIYRAPSCGIHDLFVVVNKGKSNEIMRRSAPVRVSCTASAVNAPINLTR